jgi:hypothetical protein
MPMLSDVEMQALVDAKRDPELEALAATLVARMKAAREGSAERRMAVRQLEGLRTSSQLAGEILEELDYWGCASAHRGAPSTDRR